MTPSFFLSDSLLYRHRLEMMEIERIINDAMGLPNINNGDPLHHNDDVCRHQIVILLEVVNDATPGLKCPCLLIEQN